MKMANPKKSKIAVVIPAYKVTEHILEVIDTLPDYIWRIYVVDDACPDKSGSNLIKSKNFPDKIKLLFHEVNTGVGGAVITGYKNALVDGADIVIKMDGDGQMDPQEIPRLVYPLLKGCADYAKGNRFYDLDQIYRMPKARIFGNACLSFLCKLSSGYWNIFDPTNGYTAINSEVIKMLPLEKISKRYFFESDMLFRLNIVQAVVVDVPMTARYSGEKSNLVIKKILFEFLYKNILNFWKRIFYNYYLRGLSVASFELPLGLFLLGFGTIYGLHSWYVANESSSSAPVGTVILCAVSILIGVQFILGFISQDIKSLPTEPIHNRFSEKVFIDMIS